MVLPQGLTSNSASEYSRGHCVEVSDLPRYFRRKHLLEAAKYFGFVVSCTIKEPPFGSRSDSLTGVVDFLSQKDAFQAKAVWLYEGLEGCNVSPVYRCRLRDLIPFRPASEMKTYALNALEADCDELDPLLQRRYLVKFSGVPKFYDEESLFRKCSKYGEIIDTCFFEDEYNTLNLVGVIVFDNEMSAVECRNGLNGFRFQQFYTFHAGLIRTAMDIQSLRRFSTANRRYFGSNNRGHNRYRSSEREDLSDDENDEATVASYYRPLRPPTNRFRANNPRSMQGSGVVSTSDEVVDNWAKEKEWGYYVRIDRVPYKFKNKEAIAKFCEECGFVVSVDIFDDRSHCVTYCYVQFKEAMEVITAALKLHLRPWPGVQNRFGKPCIAKVSITTGFRSLLKSLNIRVARAFSVMRDELAATAVGGQRVHLARVERIDRTKEQKARKAQESLLLASATESNTTSAPEGSSASVTASASVVSPDASNCTDSLQLNTSNSAHSS